MSINKLSWLRNQTVVNIKLIMLKQYRTSNVMHNYVLFYLFVKSLITDTCKNIEFNPHLASLRCYEDHVNSLYCILIQSTYTDKQYTPLGPSLKTILVPC